MWAGIAAALGGNIALQALDLPGHGRSAAPDAGRDFTCQSIAAVLDRLGQGPMDLIGHSFGAVVCLAAALARPALVRTLVLHEPVLFAAAGAAGADAIANHAAVAEALEAGDRTGAARAFTALWGGGEAWETLTPDRRAAMTARIHLIPASAPALVDDSAGLLAPGRLEGLKSPVLLVEGSTSPPVIGAINAALAARLPRASTLRIAGAGHMGPVTHPGELAQAIRRHFGA
jgi:pimeloyl-ACP methyl ester carboxylesterase